MKLKQKNNNNNNNNDTHIPQCFRDQSSIWNQSNAIERFSNKCPKPKTQNQSNQNGQSEERKYF